MNETKNQITMAVKHKVAEAIYETFECDSVWKLFAEVEKSVNPGGVVGSAVESALKKATNPENWKEDC